MKQQQAVPKVFKIASETPQSSALDPVLYLLFTANLPTTRLTTAVTFG